MNMSTLTKRAAAVAVLMCGIFPYVATAAQCPNISDPTHLKIESWPNFGFSYVPRQALSPENAERYDLDIEVVELFNVGQKEVGMKKCLFDVTLSGVEVLSGLVKWEAELKADSKDGLELLPSHAELVWANGNRLQQALVGKAGSKFDLSTLSGNTIAVTRIDEGGMLASSGPLGPGNPAHPVEVLGAMLRETFPGVRVWLGQKDSDQATAKDKEETIYLVGMRKSSARQVALEKGVVQFAMLSYERAIRLADTGYSIMVAPNQWPTTPHMAALVWADNLEDPIFRAKIERLIQLLTDAASKPVDSMISDVMSEVTENSKSFLGSLRVSDDKSVILLDPTRSRVTRLVEMWDAGNGCFKRDGLENLATWLRLPPVPSDPEAKVSFLSELAVICE
ncbi:hypothetical protein COB52_01755 [Candidatus Kaiserbacteria bacterium]|nr:MAG: hypothetical protein COB52_01755 [Candidatus Kaiserbacteria bacterium]